MSLKRLDGAHFEIDIQEPMLLPYSKPIDEIIHTEMARINSFIETIIRQNPRTMVLGPQTLAKTSLDRRGGDVEVVLFLWN